MNRELNLKTPKHSVDSETLKVVLGIYYQANDWLENSIYIERARKMLLEAGLDTGDKEPQSYTKKMQILTYYGLICWEDDNNTSRRRITEIGKSFYQAWIQGDDDGMIQIILQSMVQTVFGRNNNGIPDSDSDVEVPCLALRACVDLGKLTSLIYVYLIQMIQNRGYAYTQVIQDIKSRNYQIEADEIEPSCNKYKDWKPISFLKDVGIFEEDSREYVIPKNVLDKYGYIIRILPIFNVDKFVTEETLLKKKHPKVIVPSINTSSSHFLSYLAALRTKPFLLLAGISGTGKSRIVRKLAQATVTYELQKKYSKGYESENFTEDRWKLHSPANFQLIQVKPNWHNSMDVVGYFSNIPTPHYAFTPFVEFIVRAWQNLDVPFFLCLDEMNLAPVEEYFAEFLSAIESRGFEKGENGERVYMTDPIIKPFDEFEYDDDNSQNKNESSNKLSPKMINALNATLPEIMDNKIEKYFRFKGLTLPANLMVIGTVNMDETTFSFSRKVLDRAMSIEMNEVNYDSFLQDTTDDELKAIVADFENGKYGKDVSLNSLLVNRHIETKEISEELGNDAQFTIDYLKKVNALLESTPFKLGYRAANEALIYLLASREFGQTDRMASLDRFTLMKILSRIEGDEAKLRITDTPADTERLVKAGINVEEATKFGELNVLTALRYLITSTFGAKNPKVEEESSDDSWLSVKKIDSMISQLSRDHFVTYWS